MTREDQLTSPQLVRALKLRDLVLFNLVAILGLRHLATSAKFGAGSLLIWVIAALFFFIPQGLAVSELSSRYPKEGGIYFWTKRALGESHGFLCGWCYWINNVLYYPNLLLSTAVVSTYVIGQGESGLGDSMSFVLSTTLAALWFAVFINIVGLGSGKWLQNAGGIGTYIPGIIIVLFGIYALSTGEVANPIAREAIRPDFSKIDTLNLLSTIAFAFAGLELAATMGEEVENPRRNLPRSVFISAPLIAIIYILGTGAVLCLVPNQEINIVAGFLQAISNGARRVSEHLWWLAPVCAALYTVGTLGGVGAWLIGPARVAFVIGLDHYFPKEFGRVHPRWHTPYVAILVQAILATIFQFISVLGKDTTVEEVYLIMLDMQLLIYFIPYLYLFIVFIMHRFREQANEANEEMVVAPGGRAGALIIGASGLSVTFFAMILATIPTEASANPWRFRLKVIGGAVVLIFIGVLIYWRAKVKEIDVSG